MSVIDMHVGNLRSKLKLRISILQTNLGLQKSKTCLIHVFLLVRRRRD